MLDGTMTKSDTQLQSDVVDQLNLDPAVNAPNVGVIAKDGAVTLLGTVPSNHQKLAAERATKRVSGVRAIAMELCVEIPDFAHRADGDIARAAAAVLSAATVASEAVTAVVENGWLTLEGDVEGEEQRESAEVAVAHLVGLRGLRNLITVRAIPFADEVRQKIRAAFECCADIDAENVQIQLIGDVVTLHGDVRSANEYDQVAHAAAAVPGVSTVNNFTHII